MTMWNIKQTEEFQSWFDKLNLTHQLALVEHLVVLSQFGPNLGRPYADTIKGSSIGNLKELRFRSGRQVFRLFYVFDFNRNGVMLIGGIKSGRNQDLFYKEMIKLSEKIYARYLSGNAEDKRGNK